MISRPRDSGYKQEPKYNKSFDGKVYVGIVKRNDDIQRMGRLSVWVPEIGGDENDEAKWIVCSYASPFAGATDHADTTKDSKSMGGSQISYGFWAVPPDLNNQVLIVFLNGETTKAVWFACLWQQNMNHMVPGVASNKSFENGLQGIQPPVVEYNKNDQSVDVSNPTRPRFDPLHDGLFNQGLYSDFERGVSSSSARRESPSKVFGIVSPRSNNIYIDDDPDNEFIRLRTRGGAQVLIHNTNGYIYVNSKNGNSWMEISDSGIDVYSRGSISMRTEQDFNIRADQNINIDANGTMNFTAAGDFFLQSGNNSQIVSGGSLNLTAQDSINSVSGNQINQSTNQHNTKASAINRDGIINDNEGVSNDADQASTPSKTTQIDYNDSKLNTVVSRMPTHEPFKGHPKGSVSGAVIVEPSSTTTDYGPKQFDSSTETVVKTKNQKSGDGINMSVEYDKSKDSEKIKVGNRTLSKDVESAIAKGSSVSGIDYGFMMAMAEKESSFNPNAKAKTSSALGLYQFTDGTWSAMVNKYGSKYNISSEDRLDPESNAIMAGLLAKENAASIRKSTGQEPSNTDLYMAHFLGASGASKMLNADENSRADQIAGNAAASANRSIFYNSDGTPRTVKEVKQKFANFIEPRSIAYNDNRPTDTNIA